MKKKFNTAGICNPQLHYMADISGKIDQIMLLIEQCEYFTINRPHQYGKTTIQSNLANLLNYNNEYIALDISFEAIDYEIYQNKSAFIDAFLRRLSSCFNLYSHNNLSLFVANELGKIENFDNLSTFIGELIIKTQKKLVLIIDEVDRSSNNQLFLDFLAILRDRYLMRNKNLNFPTFHSVVLSGVYDVKKLKYRIEPSATLKYNSPWNIAVDFEIDLNLNTKEIISMLDVYSAEKNILMNKNEIADKIWYYTSGYPFLISNLCKIVDEKIIPERENKNWTVEDIDNAFKIILYQQNTNFEHLIKSLENNPQLYQTVFDILINSNIVTFNQHNPIIDLGFTLGVFGRQANRVKIHNKIYEQIIYNYLISKTETSNQMPTYEGKYIKNKALDINKLLLGFQLFMQENHSGKNKEFLEKHGTLLFLAYTQPIINGQGFAFKETQISEERRLDVVITYLEQKYIIEIKIWHGENAHQEGLEQLSDYLDKQNLKKGYLLIFDFRMNEKKYKNQQIIHNDKDIFAVWV